MLDAVDSYVYPFVCWDHWSVSIGLGKTLEKGMPTIVIAERAHISDTVSQEPSSEQTGRSLDLNIL